MPPLLDVDRRLTPEQVMKAIVQGGGRMPPFAHVSEAQRRAVVDFLFGTEPAAAPGTMGDGGQAREEPPYAFAGFRRWFDREGYPAIKPPWGTLNAVDLNTPSTYMVSGRQYVVISAGGGKSGRPAGGTIVAFALLDG